MIKINLNSIITYLCPKQNSTSLARNIFVYVLAVLGLIPLACTLAPPYDRLATDLVAPTEVAAHIAPQPTFTATSPVTATPTQTSTPTLTPFPTATPSPTSTRTPLPPVATQTPLPTDTSTPAPPTKTPLPTPTPAPTWEYKLVEQYTQPTQSTLLSIMVAVQSGDNKWIPGLRLVGVDPNGVLTKSEPTAGQMSGYTPPGDVVKAGNTKFEPLSNYITGVWTFHLETADGKQVSDAFSINMDAENRVWYFFRFQP